MTSASSSPNWSTAAHWILRLAFSIRCIGLGVKYLWHPFESDSTIFATLFFEFGFSETAAQRVDDVGVYAMVVAGAVVLARLESKSGWSTWLGRLESFVLLYAFVWEALIAGTATYRGGELMSQWAIAEHGLRIATPLALLMLLGGERWGSPVEWLLRLATAVTFAIHGVKAWIAAPVFVTMVIATCQNLSEFWPEQSSVETCLKFICAADMVVAGLILCCRWPLVAMYAAAWGLITAVGRVTSSDLGWPECLLRSVHVGAPLFLYLQWRRPSDRGKNEK